MSSLLLAASSSSSGVSVAGSVFGFIGGLIVSGLVLMGTFRKAGKPVWSGFVPFTGATSCSRSPAGRDGG